MYLLLLKSTKPKLSLIIAHLTVFKAISYIDSRKEIHRASLAQYVWCRGKHMCIYWNVKNVEKSDWNEVCNPHKSAYTKNKVKFPTAPVLRTHFEILIKITYMETSLVCFVRWKASDQTFPDRASGIRVGSGRVLSMSERWAGVPTSSHIAAAVFSVFWEA